MDRYGNFVEYNGFIKYKVVHYEQESSIYGKSVFSESVLYMDCIIFGEPTKGAVNG